MPPGPVKPGLHQNFPDVGKQLACSSSRPAQEVRMDVISSFTARFERTREEELSLEDYLAECKTQPAGLRHRGRAHAQGDRRAADGRHAQRPAPVAHLRQQGHQDLPGLRRVLRHGRLHRAGGVLLPPCGAGAGREEADPVPAGPGGRRQELDRRTAEAADAGRAVLRHQGLAGERVAAGPVRPGRGRADPGEGIRHPAPLPEPHPVALGRQAARGIRRRHPQVQGRQAPSRRS